MGGAAVSPGSLTAPGHWTEWRLAQECGWRRASCLLSAQGMQEWGSDGLGRSFPRKCHCS